MALLLSLSLFELRLPSNPRKKKKKFYPLPPALSSYPRKSDRLPKFPFDLFRAERVEQNLYRGIHRYPTGLTRGKRLKDAGGRMRVDGGKGKRKRLRNLEKNSSPFVFLSFGRRLVLKRWSQKFSFDASFFIFVPGGSQLLRGTKHTSTPEESPKTRRARKKTAVFAPPPSPSSRARSLLLLLLLLLLLDFFCFAPRFRVCWGKFRETKTEREEVWREKRRLFVFQLVFFCFSRSHFLVLCRSLSLALSPFFRSAASCSRLV